MKIDKDKIEYIEFNPIKSLLTIRWRTGGQEGAIDGLTFKVDLVKEHISTYRAPYSHPSSHSGRYHGD